MRREMGWFPSPPHEIAASLSVWKQRIPLQTGLHVSSRTQDCGSIFISSLGTILPNFKYLQKSESKETFSNGRTLGVQGGKRGRSYHGWFILGTQSWGKSRNFQLESQVTQKSFSNILHCQVSKGHPSPARPGWRKLQAGLGQCYRVGWSSGKEKTFFLLWSWQKRQ